MRAGEPAYSPTNPMRISTLLINLDRATDRLQQMDEQLQRLGMSYRRLAAVEGATLAEPIDDYDETGYRIRIGKLTNKNEIGCYLSHLNAMRTLLDSDASHALILEDDALLPDDIHALLEELLEQCEHWDMVRLSSSRIGVYLPVCDLSANRQLVINARVLKNTAGYLINRKGARLCLDCLLPMKRPYDVAIDRDWSIGMRTACVIPFPITSGEQISQIPQAQRARFWRSTTFHLLHLADHIRRRIYRKGIHRRVIRKIRKS